MVCKQQISHPSSEECPHSTVVQILHALKHIFKRQTLPCVVALRVNELHSSCSSLRLDFIFEVRRQAMVCIKIPLFSLSKFETLESVLLLLPVNINIHTYRCFEGIINLPWTYLVKTVDDSLISRKKIWVAKNISTTNSPISHNDLNMFKSILSSHEKAKWNVQFIYLIHN